MASKLLIGLAAALAAAATAAPIAQATDVTDGTQPSRAAADRAAYEELAKIDPARITDSIQTRAAYTAAWQAYRGLSGGPPISTRSNFPPIKTGQGFSFRAPNGWPIIRQLRVGAAGVLSYPPGVYPGVAPAPNTSSYRSTRATPPAASGSGGFDWGDAGIGAAAMFGIILLVGAAGAVLIAARNRRQPRHA
jgi:hypothetical protein